MCRRRRAAARAATRCDAGRSVGRRTSFTGAALLATTASTAATLFGGTSTRGVLGRAGVTTSRVSPRLTGSRRASTRIAVENLSMERVRAISS
ncbi:MAG TPA: hypothetical protein VFD59_05085 [Nocardioidaceae bacterium]|nr:hypothetical protein [Nocardioidaceae bacterium]